MHTPEPYIDFIPEGSAETSPPVVQALGGAYEGASRLNRETALWAPPVQSPDAEINRAKPLMDARSRDMVRNDGYANGTVAIHRDSIVGGMYMLNARPNWRALGLTEEWAEQFQQFVEPRFRLWAESPFCYPDAARKNTLTGLVRLAVGGFVYAGEVLATAEWIRKNDCPIRTAIQMVNPDRLCNPYEQEDTETLRAGVEIDRYGAAQAYHIRLGYLNDPWIGRSYEWRRVAAKKPWGRAQVVHILEQMRPDQTRGVSEMVAVLKEMRMTKKFKDIVLQNAVVNATYAAVIESELPREAAFQQLGEGGTAKWAEQYINQIAEYVGSSKNIHIDGVKIPHLYPGTKLNLLSAGTPGGVGTSFEESLLRHIASALGLSYEQFSRDYTKTNYSSARASMNETWKYMQSRKKVVADRFATHIYLLWLEEEFSKGELPLPANAPNFWEGLNKEAYGQCEWVGASRGQIDELKETQAAVLRIASGLSTYEAESARLGNDYRDIFDQRAREEKAIAERGLVFNTSPKKPGTLTEQDSTAREADAEQADANEDDDADTKRAEARLMEALAISLESRDQA